MTPNLILKKKIRVSHAIQGICISCCKTSLHWAGKMRNKRKHACKDSACCKKKKLLSATTIPNLQQPADFLQGLNRGW